MCFLLHAPYTALVVVFSKMNEENNGGQEARDLDLVNITVHTSPGSQVEEPPIHAAARAANGAAQIAVPEPGQHLDAPADLLHENEKGKLEAHVLDLLLAQEDAKAGAGTTPPTANSVYPKASNGGVSPDSSLISSLAPATTVAPKQISLLSVLCKLLIVVAGICTYLLLGGLIFSTLEGESERAQASEALGLFQKAQEARMTME